MVFVSLEYIWPCVHFCYWDGEGLGRTLAYCFWFRYVDTFIALVFYRAFFVYRNLFDFPRH